MATSRRLAREEAPELRIARTRGSYLFDSRGRKYVDFLMGWCVGNLGWGNAVVQRAVKVFKGPEYVYPHYDYPPWDELAKLLVSIAPRGLATCFRATGGSEAVDLALQAAQVHTGRGKYLSLEGAYHGNTLAGLSVGDRENREKRRNLLPGCVRVKPPLGERALGAIERALRGREVAAFILEPVSMNLGVLLPEPGFFDEAQRLCRRYGTLLIADEVATGFGRTGRFFACEHFRIQPDMMVVAKALSDGAGGIGAMLATDKVGRSMRKDGSFYSTYGWHPRSTEAAIATAKVLRRDRKRLLGNVAAMSRYFTARLKAMRWRKGATLRVLGLAIGIDFGDEKYVSRLAVRCRDEGLLVSAEGNTLLLIPALDIDERTARAGLDILERCAAA
jgi:acetylornithine/succinyldiaminopimelate/putrescine aminotransferase